MDYLDDKIITITAQESAERIDALLARCVPELTRSAAARLVHDDEIIVLVHDVERDVLCSKRGLRSVRQQNLKHVARGSFVIFLHGRAVFRHGALLQQPLGSAARESRYRARKESVDAFGALLCL